jgi:two-component system heavy metal sensor histidine kinase CusS
MTKRSYSLTAQLGALFAVVAVMVFSAVGFYLYQALAIQLLDRDDADLVERMLQIRHLLEETASAGSIRLEPHRFLDAVDVSRGLLLVIQAKDGQVLAQNTTERSFARSTAEIAAGSTPSPADTRAQALANGARLRVLNAAGRIGASDEVVHVALARTAHERLAVLGEYRLKVWAAAIAGAVLTAALGYLLVYRGLSKVRALAAQAQQVTAHNLTIRLHAQTAPAELRLLADSFNAVLDRLQSSFSNLSQFADDLAHDLRTPLNNLMVQTEVVFSQPRDSEEYQNLLSSTTTRTAANLLLMDCMINSFSWVKGAAFVKPMKLF